jgi:DNA-nicking Smr family endonuclease
MAKNKKGSGLSGDDVEAWKKVASGVKAYAGKKIHKPSAEPEEDEPETNIRFLWDVRDILPGEQRRPVSQKPLSIGDLTPLDKATAEKFQKGELRIQARLDLHGYRQDEASRALYQFIRDCYDHQKRCVLVITGKGRSADTKVGVLQQNVPRWLGLPGVRECIVAATYARPRDGGDGAIYVFIRRIRRER